MSVIATLKIRGDTETFKKALQDRADEFRQMAEQGKAAGALHHQFTVGDGYVLVVDEWESGEAFQKFVNAPQLTEFIGSIGGDTSVAPELAYGDTIDSPDRF